MLWQLRWTCRIQLASPNYVMDLELTVPAAALAFPAVPLKDVQLQLAVTLGAEPKPPSLSKVAMPIA